MYLEIREFDLKLSGKPGNYHRILFHELAGNPVLTKPLNVGDSIIF